MLFNTPFREKALARRARQEAVDARLQITAPHEWLLVAGLGVALLVLLAYGLFGRVERSLSVDTVLLRPGERSPVVALASGVVVEVLSKVGDTVVPGQPIARMQVLRATRPDAVPSRLGDADVRQDPEAEDPGAQLAAARVATAQRSAGNFATVDIAPPRGGVLAMLALAVSQSVAAGEVVARIRASSAGPWEAFGFVTREEAVRLGPGMQAQVRLAVPGSGTRRILAARVEDVSPRVVTPPGWLTEFGLQPPVRSHLLRATLTDTPPPIVEGVGGSLRVVLGDSSIVSLLFGYDGE